MKNFKKLLPYSRQWINQKDIDLVTHVLRSDYLTQGEILTQFESSVAKYCGIRYAVAFSSGTAALHGASFAAEIGSGDEVITTPLTFAASANCVLYLGGTPVFVDIRADLPLIDSEKIESKISSKTKAIIPVDFSGLPADYDEINKLARKHKLTVIADAAHSFGARYKNRKVGTLADMTVLSFHPVKTITTGEGGMVVTNSKYFYERLRLFRTHGITKNPKLLHKKNVGPWYYEMQELGFNYRLTDIQAALGLGQLKRIDTFVAKRRSITKRYTQAFKNMSCIKIVNQPKDRQSAWHLFPIVFNTKQPTVDRKKAFLKFHEMGLKVQVHYIPTHLHPFYQKQFGFKRGDYPNAEAFYDGEISIPVFPLMKSVDIKRTIDVTSKLLQPYEI